MRKLLSVFLAGCLLLLLPATIWASAETTYESESGTMAMIKAPSSASPNASANTEADVDSSDDSEGTLSPSGSSSGMGLVCRKHGFNSVFRFQTVYRLY